MDTNRIRTITHRMMATSNDEFLAAITVRIEKSTYRAAVNSGDPIDYLAKNLKRHLKNHGISSDELWFSLELAYENDCLKNPHIHGTIKIKRNQYQDLLNALQGALGKPLVKSAARKRQVREVYSLDWADYCLKNVEKTSQFIDRRAVFIARPITKSQSQVFGKNDFSKNAQNPCPDWSESGTEKVLSSYVFKPLKITTKDTSKVHQKPIQPERVKPHIDSTLKHLKNHHIYDKDLDAKAGFTLTKHQSHKGGEKFSARGRKSSPNGRGEQLRKANEPRIQCKQHQDTET
ncbi:hypothetical protein [Vibrio crassostreae]|uniref:hypothetical protein n=1 Tax=Vibrio crassostreae TaxID=246167 RepID=UPI00104971A2|nr:hypothetical protein [Vibrio crassostreae]